MSGSVPNNFVSQNGVTTLADSQLNTAVQTDQTATQLRGFVGIVGMAVSLQGLSSAGDGGSGLFYWNTGTFTDDGITTIVPYGATGQGAWIRAPGLYSIPKYTVSGLPSVAAANQGAVAYATNGRNTGEGAGSGTGCLCTVNSAGIWAAVYSGVAVTS